MKTQPLSALKRFLSLLILDKDIIETRGIEPKITPKEASKSPSTQIKIQPEEIGGREDIDTTLM